MPEDFGSFGEFPKRGVKALAEKNETLFLQLMEVAGQPQVGKTAKAANKLFKQIKDAGKAGTYLALSSVFSKMIESSMIMTPVNIFMELLGAAITKESAEAIQDMIEFITSDEMAILIDSVAESVGDFMTALSGLIAGIGEAISFLDSVSVGGMSIWDMLSYGIFDLISDIFGFFSDMWDKMTGKVDLPEPFLWPGEPPTILPPPEEEPPSDIIGLPPILGDGGLVFLMAEQLEVLKNIPTTMEENELITVMNEQLEVLRNIDERQDELNYNLTRRGFDDPWL